MSPPHEVDALVLAAGRGDRLGLGPKAWLMLGGRTLLERAVATMCLVADCVFVGVAPDHVDRARALCGNDVVVVPGGATQRETMLNAFRAGSAPLVLIHDVAHPFVTPILAREVIKPSSPRRWCLAVHRTGRWCAWNPATHGSSAGL
jgi:2-C-methyl-D-erythritol 4-phosphate cytidylyltransferase